MRRNYPPDGFYKRLNEVILKSKYTTTEIIEKACIPESCFYSYMRGYTTPSIATLVNLCKVLEVSADYLLFGEKRS